MKPHLPALLILLLGAAFYLHRREALQSWSVPPVKPPAPSSVASPAKPLQTLPERPKKGVEPTPQLVERFEAVLKERQRERKDAMLSPQGGPRIDRQLLAAKADEIDANIRQLQAMSRGLRHAAACPAPSHAACPSFQRLLKAAAAGALEGRQKRARRRMPGTPAPQA